VYNEQRDKISLAYDLAAEQQKAIRSIFAQHAIKAQDIEIDLKEVDAVIGDVATVADFVSQTLAYLGVQFEPWKKGHRLYPDNLPEDIKAMFPKAKETLLSFQSPTPDGYRYIGRNHPLVERLSQIVLANALYPENNRFHVGRSSVLRTKEVTQVTVLAEYRVRNVIATLQGRQEIVAEEMLLWGWQGDAEAAENHLNAEQAKDLLNRAVPSANITPAEQSYWLDEALSTLQKMTQVTDALASQRADHLIEAHERFREALDKGHRFKVVEPILPMDLLGLYILVPDNSKLN
jgi:hypothetical protein